MCFVIKLGRDVNHGERMNLMDIGGHRSKVKVMMDIIDKCWVRGDATVCVVIFYFFERVTRHKSCNCFHNLEYKRKC